MRSPKRRRRGAAPGVVVLALLAGTLSTGGPAWAEPPSVDVGYAVLRGLDKVTARASSFVVGVGEAAPFGTLTVTVSACRTTTPDQAPEDAVFLEIVDTPPGETATSVFAGWMFSSSPAVSALDHPVFDVWLDDCVDEIPRPPEDMGFEDEVLSLPEARVIPPALPEGRR